MCCWIPGSFLFTESCCFPSFAPFAPLFAPTFFSFVKFKACITHLSSVKEFLDHVTKVSIKCNHFDSHQYLHHSVSKCAHSFLQAHLLKCCMLIHLHKSWTLHFLVFCFANVSVTCVIVTWFMIFHKSPVSSHWSFFRISLSSCCCCSMPSSILSLSLFTSMKSLHATSTILFLVQCFNIIIVIFKMVFIAV